MSKSRTGYFLGLVPLAAAALFVSSLAAAAGGESEIPLVATVVSSILSPGTQTANGLPEISVAPSAQITTEVLGVAPTGWPIDKVTMTLPVSYSDLNLATASGADELHKRIVKGAFEACNYLSANYPGGDYGGSNLPGYPGYQFTDQECVQNAIHNADAAARVAMSKQNYYR